MREPSTVDVDTSRFSIDRSSNATPASATGRTDSSHCRSCVGQYENGSRSRYEAGRPRLPRIGFLKGYREASCACTERSRENS